MDLKEWIRDIPDFPAKGIIFKDITPLLKHPAALDISISKLAADYDPATIDYVVSVESRGFIFGVPLARELNAGFIPIRKAGKLPAETVEVSYDLEYGTDTIAMHKDALKKGDRIILVDDVLATGGTMLAAVHLVEKMHADIIGISCLIELGFLEARKRIPAKYPIHSHILY